MDNFPQNFLSSTRKQFEYYKMLGEKTFRQLGEEALFWQYNPELLQGRHEFHSTFS